MRRIVLILALLMLICFCVSCSCEDEEIATGERGECAHYWNNAKIVKPATIEETGQMAYSCSLCDEIRVDIIPKLSHDHIYGNGWEVDRLNHWHSCGVRNCTVKGSKGAHEWDKGTILVEADQTTSGTKRFVCKVCAYEKVESYTATAQVTRKEFEKAISRDAFTCVTYEAVTLGDCAIVKIANGYVLYKGSVAEDNAENKHGSYYLASELDGIDFDSLEYDKSARAYLYKQGGVIASLQFADGHLCVFSITRNGVTAKYKLSSYGRTSFEIR